MRCCRPIKPEPNPRDSPERPTLRKSERVLKDKDAESTPAASVVPDGSYSATASKPAEHVLPPMPMPQSTQQLPPMPKPNFSQGNGGSVSSQNDLRQQYEAMYNVARPQVAQRAPSQTQQTAGPPPATMPQQMLPNSTPQHIAPNAFNMRIPGGLPQQQMQGMNYPGQTGMARFPGQLR